jgi:hypothetical protein
VPPCVPLCLQCCSSIATATGGLARVPVCCRVRLSVCMCLHVGNKALAHFPAAFKSTDSILVSPSLTHLASKKASRIYGGVWSLRFARLPLNPAPSGKGSTGGSDNEMPSFCAYNFPVLSSFPLPPPSLCFSAARPANPVFQRTSSRLHAHEHTDTRTRTRAQKIAHVRNVHARVQGVGALAANKRCMYSVLSTISTISTLFPSRPCM